MAEQSQNTQANNKRIAKNTIMLYIRQVLIMAVGLYTVRVVLKTLGVEDYGVYNVVSGAVTMFGFLSGAMALGSQRFFSFYLGKNDIEGLKKIFHNTLSIYLIISIIVVVLGESIGLWFINSKLDIPSGRMFAANCIFQISLISFIVSMMSAPFMAAIMSHEDMGVYARVGILEVVLKLVVVFALVISPFDKLVSYGLLLLSVSVIVLSIYSSYCKRKYEECTIAFRKDKDVIYEIASFSGWNLFGNFAWVIKNQGTSFMLNIFFGPVMNAAQNLATQIRTIVNTFASNFTSAVQPQIVKSYAQKDYNGMFKLMSSACKMSYLLMAVIAVPVVLNVDYILHLWLYEVPDHAVTFTQIMLVEATIEAMSTPTASANQATGKIKYYQMIIGILGILNLPVAYCFLIFGVQAEVVYVISLILQSCIVIHRALYLRKIEPSIGWRVIGKVFIPCVVSGLIAFVVCYYLYTEATTFVTTILTCIYEMLIVTLLTYFVAFNSSERTFANNILKTSFTKILRK